MRLNRRKAVIFDLDDTLTDLMWTWKAIDIEYLARFGLTCPDNLQKEIEDTSFSETAVYFKERFQLKETLDEIKDTRAQMFIKKHRGEVPLKPGTGAFLEFISEKGLVAGTVTSSGRAIVDAALDFSDIRRYFKVVTTACEVVAGKSAPDIYLSVAEHLQVAPEDCVVFEDVPADTQAGKNAGMIVPAVEDAFSLEMKEEREELAGYYIRDYYKSLDGAARWRTIIYL